MSELSERFKPVASHAVLCENCGRFIFVPAGISGEFYCSPKCHQQRRGEINPRPLRREVTNEDKTS